MASSSAPAAAPAAAPPPSYGTTDYWEQRYASRTDEKIFEWYVAFHCIEQPLLRVLSPEHKILHIGNGNSALPEDLHARGYRDQLAQDISPTVVARMAERTAHCHGLCWAVEDALAMPHSDGTFDCVIDKGTFDALNCGGVQARRLVAEVYRVLKVGGTYALLSSLESSALAFGEPYWIDGTWALQTTRVASGGIHAGSECWVHCATKAPPPTERESGESA